MIAELRRKPVIIGILSFVVAALVVGLAVPAITASAASPPRGPTGTRPSKNITRVSGNITALTNTSITIKTSAGATIGPLIVGPDTNFALRGVTGALLNPSTGTVSLSLLLSGPVTVVYDSKTMAAEQVMINMPSPTPGMGTQANRNVTRVTGTIYSVYSNSSGSFITINTGTTSAPVYVTLALGNNTNFTIHGVTWLPITGISLDGLPVTAVYNNNQAVTPPVASQVMISMPSPPLGPPGTPRNFGGWFGGSRHNGNLGK